MITRSQLATLSNAPGFGAFVGLLAVAALVAGLIVGGLLARWWYASDLEAMRDKAAASAAAVGVANATAQGCDTEIQRLQAAAKTERERSDTLVASLAKAEVENDALRRAAADRRGQILRTPIRGATEGEQCVNAVADHLRGAKP